MYSWPSTSVRCEPEPDAMNGGYGFQPNLTVRALLPAPPGMISLAALNSSPERAAKRGYSVWKSIVTSDAVCMLRTTCHALYVVCILVARPYRRKG